MSHDIQSSSYCLHTISEVNLYDYHNSLLNSINSTINSKSTIDDKNGVYQAIFKHVMRALPDNIHSIDMANLFKSIGSVISNIRSLSKNYGKVYEEDGFVVIPDANQICNIKRDDKFFINKFSVVSSLNKCITISNTKYYPLLLKLFDVPVACIKDNIKYNLYKVSLSEFSYDTSYLDLFFTIRYIMNLIGTEKFKPNLFNHLSDLGSLINEINSLSHLSINDEYNILVPVVLTEGIVSSRLSPPQNLDDLEKDISMALMLIKDNDYVLSEVKSIEKVIQDMRYNFIEYQI